MSYYRVIPGLIIWPHYHDLKVYIVLQYQGKRNFLQASSNDPSCKKDQS